MIRNIIIAILVVTLLVAGIVAFYENQQAQQFRQEALQAKKDKDTALMQMQKEKQMAQEQKKMEEMAKTMKLTLSEENNSGESGTATLKEQNGKVVVTISLTGFTKDASQPAHIHVGDCPGVGKVKYPLTDVVNGQSTTTLDVSMDQLKSGLPLALNVHKSKAQIGVYTACGGLGGTNATATVSPVPSVTAAVTKSVSPLPTQ